MSRAPSDRNVENQSKRKDVWADNVHLRLPNEGDQVLNHKVIKNYK